MIELKPWVRDLPFGLGLLLPRFPPILLLFLVLKVLLVFSDFRIVVELFEAVLRAFALVKGGNVIIIIIL